MVSTSFNSIHNASYDQGLCNQKAYWATVVGTSMAGTVPFIGDTLLYIIRGGAEVNGVTLIRFYSIHVLWIPFSMCIIFWAHFHMVKKQGISRGL